MPHNNFFSTFADLSKYLEQLGYFRIRPEMKRISTVLDELHLTNLPCLAVQVVGTNGKGSTATFLASLARAHGIKTGLFTSPHFVSFTERTRIDGLPISQEQCLRCANIVMAAGGKELTYFEMQTAIAAVAFAESDVDLAIMEAGLGGEWDATTALHSDLTLFTPIALDHCNILGDTLTAIATSKAGAIRPGVPVISAPQPVEVLRVLEQKTQALAAPLSFCSGKESLTLPASRLAPRLTGPHQTGNASLALTAWRYLTTTHGWKTNDATEADALAKAFIPGRLQYIAPSPEHKHPAMLLDGAHNIHGVAALSQALVERGTAPAVTIFACLSDKDAKAMTTHIRVLSTGPIFVPPIQDNPRSLPPEEIAAAIGVNATPVASLEEAIARAWEHVQSRMPQEVAAHPERHPVLLCGSLYLLSEFFTLRPECLE